MRSIRSTALLACLTLLIPAAADASNTPTATAAPAPRIARLGLERPPRLTAKTPLVPETAPAPPRETAANSMPHPSPDPLGDLSGFVRISLDVDPAPAKVASRNAKPDRQMTSVPADDPIVAASVFPKAAAVLPASPPSRTTGRDTARKPSAPGTESGPKSGASPAKSATRDDSASTRRPKPAAAPARAAVAGPPSTGAGTVASATVPSSPESAPAVAPAPQRPPGILARLTKRVKGLSPFARKKSRDEAPPRSLAELSAEIRATSEFRRGQKPSAATAVRAEAAAAGTARERAKALFAAGDHEAAAAEYARALSETPRDAELRKFHGLSLTALERYDEAVEELRRAAEIEPGDGGVRVALARALAGRGRAKMDAGDPSARADLEKALALDPASRQARRALERLAAGDRG